MTYIDEEKKDDFTIGLFLFPLILAAEQFCFAFVALFKSGFPFVSNVLGFDFIFVVLWLFLFCRYLIKSIKNKQLKKSKSVFKIIVLFFFFVITSLWIIYVSWFRNYLRIDSMKIFFNGGTFIDTLYHSAIAESFITNGYPSININAPVFISYHALSHFLISVTSRILNIPCFVTYNFIYPIIAFPVFLYLFQKTIVITKSFLKNELSLSFADSIAVIFCLLFFYNSNNTGLFHGIWLNGESYCISMIFLFSYFCIIDFGYKKIKYFEYINLILLIPFFIVLLSYSKISTGCMFFVGISYYIFRKNLRSNKKWLFSIVYFGIFICYYYITSKISVSFPKPENTGSSLEFFHYVRHYCKNGFFSVLHYILLTLPIIILIIFEKPKKLFFIFSKENEIKTLIVETVIVTTVISWLPGLLLKIDGGSAFYFVGPVIFEYFIILIALNIPKEILNFIKNKLYLELDIVFNSKRFVLNNIILILIPISLFFYEYKKISLHEMLKETVYSRLDEETIDSDSKIEKIKKIFDPSPVLQDSNYKMFTEINNITRKNRKDYCIFICDDYSMIKKYFINGVTCNKTYLINPYLSASAYTGLPVINAMYIKNGMFYLGNDQYLGKYEDFAGYSLPPAECGEKVTFDNMNNIAKSLGKKFILVIQKDFFYKLDVQ